MLNLDKWFFYRLPFYAESAEKELIFIYGILEQKMNGNTKHNNYKKET